MPLAVEAVASYNNDIVAIDGNKKQYFRIDDKKKRSQIKSDSKYFLVCLSAHKIITLTVGKKNNKHSLTTNEYITDLGWARAVRSKFSKKLISEITAEEFYNQYKEFIALPMKEEEING